MLQILPILLLIPLLGFWLWMFWDFANNPDIGPSERNIWLVAFVVLNVFAAGYYYLTTYERR